MVQHRYLAFSLADAAYAVPLLTVREVIALTDITPVPGLPDFLKGIINLRGEVISIVDLRTRFKLVKKSGQTETAIMILDVGQLRLGAIVDSVDSVLALTDDRISPVSSFGSVAHADYIRAIAKLDDKLVALLNVEKSLGVEEFVRGEVRDEQKPAAAAA